MAAISNLLEHWYAALHAKIGIVISTTHLETTVQQLYQARKAAGDPALAALSLVRSPVNPEHIWILKRLIPSEPPNETQE